MYQTPSQIIDTLLEKLDKQEKIEAIETIEETRKSFVRLELNEMLTVLAGHPFIKFSKTEATFEKLRSIDKTCYMILLGGLAAIRMARRMRMDEDRISLLIKAYDCDPDSDEAKKHLSSKRNFMLLGAFWLFLPALLMAIMWSQLIFKETTSISQTPFHILFLTVIFIGLLLSIITLIFALLDGRRNFKNIKLSKELK